MIVKRFIEHLVKIALTSFELTILHTMDIINLEDIVAVSMIIVGRSNDTESSEGLMYAFKGSLYIRIVRERGES